MLWIDHFVFVKNNILIMLNGGDIITFKVKKCYCLLEDIGKPFYPAIIPTYSKNDLYQN